MSLSRDSLLFGIALISFGIFVEFKGLGGWMIAIAGIFLAALGLLGSVVYTFRSATDARTTEDDTE